MVEDDMPCGNCDAGTYSTTPVRNGMTMFGNCESTAAALSLAPKCKLNPAITCRGAKDWISAAFLPLSEERKQTILAMCEE